MSATSAAIASARARRRRNAVELLAVLTGRELRLRYQGSIFGWAWSLARPLALGLILSFALGRVIGTGIKDYGVFLLVGLFPWFWFQSAVQVSAATYVGNGGLLKKVRFPRAVLPLSVVLGNTLQFLLTFPVLFGFLVAYGYRPGWTWLAALPLLFVLQLALIVGLSLFVASVTVFFRDLEHIVEVLLNLLFYVTPIVYNAGRIPEGYRWVIWANPLAPIAEGWRDVLLDNAWPDVELAASAAITLTIALVGWLTFRRLEDSFADAV